MKVEEKKRSFYWWIIEGILGVVAVVFLAIFLTRMGAETPVEQMTEAEMLYQFSVGQIRENGKYRYRVDMETGKEDGTYSIIRHAGVSWGLLNVYEKYGREEDFLKIRQAIFYLRSRVREKGEERFIEGDGGKYGGTALALLAFLEYYKKTSEEEYVELAKGLAASLLSAQEESGEYYHTFSADFTPAEKGKSEIYDGEINLALLRMYDETGEEKYLSAVLRSIAWMNEEKLMSDSQWGAYVNFELLKNGVSNRFVANIEKNFEKMRGRNALCDLEYLGVSVKYLRLRLSGLQEGEEAERLRELLSKVMVVYQARAEKDKREIIYEPGEFFGAVVREGEMRIDFAQHRLAGYAMLEEAVEWRDPYVELAREATEYFVRTGEEMAVPEGLPKEMYEKGAVYVGIHNAGKLRGCQGTRVARRSIAQEIIAQAARASRDARFEDVGVEELSTLEFRVDVLSELEEVTDVGELNPKEYGLVIEKDGKSAIFLPNIESIQTVEEQISKIIKKAGLPEDVTGYKLYRYRTVRHEY